MTAASRDGAVPDVLRLYTHFGAFNLKADDVIAFPSGLPGFEADRRFVLLSAPTFEPAMGLAAPEARPDRAMRPTMIHSVGRMPIWWLIQPSTGGPHRNAR